MGSIFVGQVEILNPDSKTIYIEFLPISSKKTKAIFIVELKKTTKALANFLREIKAKTTRKKQAKVNSYTKLAQELLTKKLGEVFVKKADIERLINKFNIRPRAIEGLVTFTKRVKLTSSIKIGEKIYPKDTILKFIHEA